MNNDYKNNECMRVKIVRISSYNFNNNDYDYDNTIDINNVNSSCYGYYQSNNGETDINNINITDNKVNIKYNTKKPRKINKFEKYNNNSKSNNNKFKK